MSKVPWLTTAMVATVAVVAMVVVAAGMAEVVAATVVVVAATVVAATVPAAGMALGTAVPAVAEHREATRVAITVPTAMVVARPATLAKPAMATRLDPRPADMIVAMITVAWRNTVARRAMMVQADTPAPRVMMRTTSPNTPAPQPMRPTMSPSTPALPVTTQPAMEVLATWIMPWLRRLPC